MFLTSSLTPVIEYSPLFISLDPSFALGELFSVCVWGLWTTQSRKNEKYLGDGGETFTISLLLEPNVGYMVVYGTHGGVWVWR